MDKVNIHLSKTWEISIEYLPESYEHDVCVYTNNRLKDAKKFNNALSAVLFICTFDFGSDAISRSELNEKVILYIDRLPERLSRKAEPIDAQEYRRGGYTGEVTSESLELIKQALRS